MQDPAVTAAECLRCLVLCTSQDLPHCGWHSRPAGVMCFSCAVCRLAVTVHKWLNCRVNRLLFAWSCAVHSQDLPHCGWHSRPAVCSGVLRHNLLGCVLTSYYCSRTNQLACVLPALCVVLRCAPCRTCHIVVGTPGRLCALVSSGALLLGKLAATTQPADTSQCDLQPTAIKKTGLPVMIFP
jgi:hypothetical protein